MFDSHAVGWHDVAEAKSARTDHPGGAETTCGATAAGSPPVATRNIRGDRMRDERGKPPAFQWYPKDCDTDESIRLMDDRELGFFIRCLNHAWLNDGLPNNLEEIARLIGRSKVYVEKVWQRVGHSFVLCQDGRLRNQRQEKERETQTSFRASRKAAAHTRWEQKQSTSNARAYPHAERTECSAICNLHTASANPSPSPPADFDLRPWADSIYAVWPIKDKYHIWTRYLSDTPELHDPAWREAYVEKAKAWAEHFADPFAPKKQDLADWHFNGNWKYDPPKPKSRPKSQLEEWLAQ